MTTTPQDGAPERIGRFLGRAVAKGRVAARRAGEPETRDRLAKVAAKAWEDRGPDVAEVVANRAVDRALWVLRARAGILGPLLEPFAREARDAASAHARRLAATKRAEGSEEPAAAPPTESDPPKA